MPLWVFTSCSSNSDELQMDCLNTNLELSIVDQTDADCMHTGDIEVVANGGTAPYVYSSDGINFQSSEVISGLSAGAYTLFVKDNTGCQSSIQAQVQGGIQLDAVVTDTSCGENTGAILVSASNGFEPYSYSLDGGLTQSTGSFTGLSNKAYTIRVIDANSCEAERVVHVGSGVSLSADIMPVIVANCAVVGCHNGSRFPDLRTNLNVINSAGSIQFRTASTANPMPPSDRTPLAQSDLQKIACWVEDGARNN